MNEILKIDISRKIIPLIKDIEMNPVSQNINTADFYFGFLKNLRHDSKLDLITKLSESLKGVEARGNTSLDALFGAYKSEETAEEIIAELRASRTFNRKTEML
jgi:hypothetical protein